MTRNARAAVTQLHRWTGLTVGIVVLYLAATGAWIVLRPLLDPITYPQLLVIRSCAKPLPVDTLAAAARASHPSGRLTYVYLYGSPTASTMVRFSDADQVYVDGCSGKVLGHQARYGGLYGTAEALHKMRFAPAAAAKPIIGYTSLLLATVLVAGGLFAWWPRRRSGWKRALTLDRSLTGRAFAVRLHTTTGVYASAVIFVVALTAVPLSLGWGKQALFVMTRSADMTQDTRTPAVASRKPGTRIPMQTAWNEARALAGGPLRWASIHYPAKGEPIEVGIVPTTGPHGDARTYVYIDPRTGKVLEFRPYATLSAGSKLYYWALALHTGHAGGTPVQIVMLAGMIGVTVIGYAGVDSFLRKAFRRGREAPAGKRLMKTPLLER